MLTSPRHWEPLVWERARQFTVEKDQGCRSIKSQDNYRPDLLRKLSDSSLYVLSSAEDESLVRLCYTCSLDVSNQERVSAKRMSLCAQAPLRENIRRERERESEWNSSSRITFAVQLMSIASTADACALTANRAYHTKTSLMTNTGSSQPVQAPKPNFVRVALQRPFAVDWW